MNFCICPNCNGVGKDRITGYECFRCFGTGRTDGKVEQPCFECRGAGKEYNAIKGRDVICGVCCGTGKLLR